MATFRSKNNRSGLRTFKPAPKKIPTGKYTVRVESLADDGRGIATNAELNDKLYKGKQKRIFIAGGLPGELISIRYIASHKDYDQAQLIKVLEPSDHRSLPPCEYYQQCGGCSFQHLDYQQQLIHKRQRLLNQFQPLMLSDTTEEAVLSANDLAYRHRARLAVSASRDDIKIGFRQKDSHNVVDVDRCLVVYAAINDKLPLIKTMIASLKSRSVITELAITEDSDGQQGILISYKKTISPVDVDTMIAFAAEQHIILCLQGPKDHSSVQLWPAETATFNYSLAAYQLSLPHSITDFTQVNPAINQQLIATAIKWLQIDATDNIADFFCGIGNFSLPMAQLAASVTGYELIPAMVDKGTASSTQNAINNVQFLCRDLMAEKANLVGSYNKVLLDPPRSGALALCQQLYGLGVQSVVYISCNPATLLRDAKVLVDAGYRLEKLTLADMFPHTQHSEAMALFCIN